MSKQKKEIQNAILKVPAQSLRSPFPTPSPVQRALLDADKVPIKRTLHTDPDHQKE